MNNEPNIIDQVNHSLQTKVEDDMVVGKKAFYQLGKHLNDFAGMHSGIIIIRNQNLTSEVVVRLDHTKP